MKVRLEIIDDDDTIIESSEFSGRHWKKRLLGVLDDVEDENATITEPSSISSNSEVPIAEQSDHQTQVVQQQAPSDIQQNVQQPVQQTAPVQQVQPVQQQQVQPVYQQQQFQHPVQQVPLQQPQQPPQYQQNYVQQPAPLNYPPSQLVQSNLPPVGQQQYGYGQPVQQTPSTVHPPVTPNMPTPPAASYPAQSMQRRTPRLQERMNESLTINERLELFLRYEYPRVWFSSQDIQQHYERVYGTIKQSTVSTYLSRMYRKNLLERRGNRTQREYRYIADEPESTYRMEESSDAPVYHRLQY